jgi:Sulfatase-modifying factor enzyme 1/PEP-CTERM motif
MPSMAMPSRRMLNYRFRFQASARGAASGARAKAQKSASSRVMSGRGGALSGGTMYRTRAMAAAQAMLAPKRVGHSMSARRPAAAKSQTVPNTNAAPIGAPYYRTEVGAFVNSASPYGSFDQDGNVWEMNETSLHQDYRGLRGGSYYRFDYSNLHASVQNYFSPSNRDINLGFRVASVVPEPSTVLLATLACGAMWWSRKRFIL